MTDNAPVLHFTPCPASLSQVACMVSRGCDYGSAMKEFIDHLIRVAAENGGWRNGRLQIPPTVFLEEPEGLADPVHLAHLAGMAEHLAGLSGQAAPDWCFREKYFLEEPRLGGGERSRAAAIENTPAAFARRKLFCGRALGKLHGVPDGRP